MATDRDSRLDHSPAGADRAPPDRALCSAVSSRFSPAQRRSRANCFTFQHGDLGTQRAFVRVRINRNARFGSFADIEAPQHHVRLALDSRHRSGRSAVPLRANKRNLVAHLGAI
jgi:hypothetical protein